MVEDDLLKNHLDTDKIPVIIFSSHPYIYETIASVQANDVITKPFETAVFLQRIHKQLCLCQERAGTGAMLFKDSASDFKEIRSS